MAGPGYERGDGIELEPWWVEELIALIDVSPHPQKRLAELAAAPIGRTEPWDQSAVSRFKSGANRTREIAEGLAKVLGMPAPMYMPRSMKEALALQAVARGFDPTTTPTSPNPDLTRKLSDADQVLDVNQELESDQTAPVTSSDERSKGRRGARRSPRRSS